MRRRLALLAAFAVLLAACGDTQGQRTIVVSAASSLTDTFTDVATAFEAANDGVSVDLNFASSSSLATQIVEGGAPVDVFASANEAQMALVIEAGDASHSDVFAQNRLVVVTPPGSPLRSFEGLRDPGVRLVLAAPDVPIGAYAREAIAAAGVSGEYGDGFEAAVLDNVVSEEANVRQVLTKVELGEADAGIVYATDATLSGDAVEVIPVPEAFAPLAVYPIAVIATGNHAGEARAFIEFVRGPEGRAILERDGFVVP